MTRFIPVTMAAVAAALCAAPAPAEEPADEARNRQVRLSFNAPAGVPVAGVVEGGVPFPMDLGITDVSQIELVRSTGPGERDVEVVPVQWKVLSRWHGRLTDLDRPVRWALARFAAPAGGNLSLRLLAAGGGAGAAAPRREDQLLAREDDRGVTLDTGSVRLSLPKDRFAPLSGLRLVRRDRDGKEQEQPLLQDDGIDVTLVTAEQRNAPQGPVEDFTYRLSETKPRLVAIEDNGPLRAVLKVQGTFGQGEELLGGFIGYTLRIVADKGSDSFRIFFTLENNGTYGPPAEHSIRASEPKWLHIRRLDLSVPLRFTGAVTAATADGKWELAGPGDGPEFRLLQAHDVNQRADEAVNFSYTLEARGSRDGKRSETKTAGRSEGGVLLHDGASAVFAGVRHFWQQYPKAISLDEGALRFELWPQGPGLKWPQDLDSKWGDAYQFEGGRHKTYEMALTFGSAVPVDPIADVTARQRAFQQPPLLVVDPNWIASSRAIVPFAVPQFEVANLGLGGAQEHFRRMQLAQVDVTYADAQGVAGEIAPASLITQRETRGNALPAVTYDLDLYGWTNFGDLPHDVGYCSGHFDWHKGLFMNWLRYGKREFHDIGVEMLRHRYDWDQYHGQERMDPNWRWFNGFQRFDVGFHGARMRTYHPHGEWTAVPQQTWLEGLLLAHCITGDPRALEAARENADAFVNYFMVAGELDESVRKPMHHYGQISVRAMAMKNLLAFYEFTGEPLYYETARKIFTNGVLYAEEYYGNAGFFGIIENRQNVFPLVRLLEPLMDMHRVSGDPDALALLLRALNWLREEGYERTGLVYEDGSYLPLQLPYGWEDGGDLKVWYIPYNFLTADAYTYAYLQTGEPAFLNFARELFRDSAIFYQAPVHRPVPPGFYSHVSYAPRQYPNSETKPGAWMLTGHQWYLATEQDLAGRTNESIELRADTYFRASDEIRRAQQAPSPSPPPVRDVTTSVPRVPEGPPPVRPRAQAEVVSSPAGEFVLDESQAKFEGDWQEQKTGKAHGGTQRVSVSGFGSQAARAQWTVTPQASGRYRLFARWGETQGASGNARVEIRDANGFAMVRLDQRHDVGKWRMVGEVLLTTSQPFLVIVSNAGSTGNVVADAFRLEPVR